MRFALIASLIASTALADVTVNGTVQVVTDGGIELKDQYGERLSFAESRLDTGRDTPLFSDRFVGSAIAAHNKWAQSILTQTVTVSGGAATLNASAITTVNTYSNLLTPMKFRAWIDGALYFHGRIRPNNLPQTNALAEVGLGNALTNATPTDGAFFRWTASGGFEAVLNRGGAETSTSMTAPASGVYSIFAIEVWGDGAEFRYQTPSTGADVRAVITIDSGATGAFNESPGAMLRVVNGAVAPASAPQLLVGDVEVLRKVLDEARPVSHTATTQGVSSVFTPTTGAQSANNANSAAPASATLSNTAAGYTTLGGRWQFAAVVGAATDYALFGYQVPTSYRFVITGVSISSCNTVAAVATTATALEWSLGVGSTAVSLATADATAATPTSAPRRISLGKQSFAIGAAAEACATDVQRTFLSPIAVESGRFLHVILQVPTGTATATEIFRGTVTIDGYFEQ